MNDIKVLDRYVDLIPSIQNALDIFQGQWSSSFPGNLASLKAGHIPLFEDSRILWASEALGGVKGKRILELGPLEAGHTYMLEKLGAELILGIEANIHAYLKCLIVKETLELKQAKFLCGNFIKYLQSCQEKFDICWASGVLYHMTNPVELMSLISKVSNSVYFWTHYFDKNILESDPNLAPKFYLSGTPNENNGFQCKYYRQEYQSSLQVEGFCGGSKPFSYWMSREDIISCLKFFGFNKIKVHQEFDHPNHPHGPSFALIATK